MPRAKHQPPNAVALRLCWIINDKSKLTTGKTIQLRKRTLVAQQAFRRHDNQRLAKVTVHLPPQHMKVLTSVSGVADLQIVLGAELQEPLQAGAGMLGALPFISVRQEQHDPAHSLPFRFAAGNELVDDRLRAIREAADLR